MTTDSATGPPALACPLRGMVWRDGVVEDAEVTLDEISSVAEDDGRLVWLDLVGPSAADVEALADRLGLGPTVVEDVTAPHERPKVIRAADHLFFMTYAVGLRPEVDAMGDGHGRLTTSRVSGLILPNGIVTIREDDAFDMDEVVRRWNENADLLAKGPGALLHGLLDAIVDGQFETIQELDDAIEGLEDVLFTNRGVGGEFLRRIYGFRKDLVELRRIVLPTRELVNGVLRHRAEDAQLLSKWYDDLYDHVLRAAEWTESLRDMVTTLFETNLSMQDTRLNQVMRKLAAWAAIIAVPTAVTGWFGQNIPYPGFSKPLGLWLSAVLIVAISGGLWLGFRKRGWL